MYRVPNAISECRRVDFSQEVRKVKETCPQALFSIFSSYITLDHLVTISKQSHLLFSILIDSQYPYLPPLVLVRSNFKGLRLNDLRSFLKVIIKEWGPAMMLLDILQKAAIQLPKLLNSDNTSWRKEGQFVKGMYYRKELVKESLLLTFPCLLIEREKKLFLSSKIKIQSQIGLYQQGIVLFFQEEDSLRLNDFCLFQNIGIFERKANKLQIQFISGLFQLQFKEIQEIESFLNQFNAFKSRKNIQFSITEVNPSLLQRKLQKANLSYHNLSIYKQFQVQNKQVLTEKLHCLSRIIELKGALGHQIEQELLQQLRNLFIAIQNDVLYQFM